MKVVEYNVRPRFEGYFYVAFALAFALLSWATVVEKGVRLLPLAILATVTLGLLGLGLYYIFLKRGWLRRTVVLGNWPHRIYVYSRWLFAVISVLFTIVVYVVVKVLFGLFDGLSPAEVIGGLCSLSRSRALFGALFVFYAGLREFLSYYSFYRSPVESRTEVVPDEEKGKE